MKQLGVHSVFQRDWTVGALPVYYVKGQFTNSVRHIWSSIWIKLWRAIPHELGKNSSAGKNIVVGAKKPHSQSVAQNRMKMSYGHQLCSSNTWDQFNTIVYWPPRGKRHLKAVMCATTSHRNIHLQNVVRRKHAERHPVRVAWLAAISKENIDFYFIHYNTKRR